MQFINNHPFISGFLIVILFNFLVKKITKSKQSPIKILLMSLVYVIAQACNPFSGAVNKQISNNYYYTKSGKEIRYSPNGNWLELGNSKLAADVQTFTPLAREFGKDKDHIFYKSTIIDTEVDVSSFRVINTLGFDKNHVYIPIIQMSYITNDAITTDKKLVILEGADPKTYTELKDWGFGKDSKNWFYEYRLIDVDYNSFTPINRFFCKDNNNVYLRKRSNLLSSHIDAKTFVALNDRYVADAKYIYDFIPWTDGKETNTLNMFAYKSLENIEYLYKEYLLFDNSVIYDGVLIKEADRKSFKVLDSDKKEYSKDKEHVFYLSNIIVGADVNTFELYESEVYAKDKNGLYCYGIKMEGVDLETFGPVTTDNFEYKDKNHTYIFGKIKEVKQ